MKKIAFILSLSLVASLALAYKEGQLPTSANAQPVEVDTICEIIVGGEATACYYDPHTQTWTPSGITNNPTAKNCLDAAAAGIHNSAKIATEFNLLLEEFNKNKKEVKADIDALQEGLNALWDALADLDEDGEVEINECDLCNHATTFEDFTLYPDGSYKVGTTTSSGCASTAKKIADGIVDAGKSISENRTRIVSLEEFEKDATEIINSHGVRITALENKNNSYATKAQVTDLENWAKGQHSDLSADTADVKFALQAHIQNCNGGSDGTNIIEFATCDLCSKTNGVEVTELSFVGYKQAVGDKPAVPAHIESKKGTAIGCNDALKQVGDNVSELETAVGTVLYLPERVETHIEWAEQDSAKQWEEISKNAFKESTYQGSVSSLAEALDPNNDKTVGGKIMFQPSTSSTNYFTLSVGKLSYPPCEGVSSNDVEEIVKNYIDSEGGGCTCTPDEYLKEETDPIWEEEKSDYATLQDLEEAKDILAAQIEQMQMDIEAYNLELLRLESEIGNMTNKLEEVYTLSNSNSANLTFLDDKVTGLMTRITALESLTNNATGGN